MALVALGVALWVGFLPRTTGDPGELADLCGRAFWPTSLEYLQDIDETRSHWEQSRVVESCTSETGRARTQAFVALGVAAIAAFVYFVPNPYKEPDEQG